MEPYTVAFIGHRYIDDFRNTEHRLYEIVAKLIMEKECSSQEHFEKNAPMGMFTRFKPLLRAY